MTCFSQRILWKILHIPLCIFYCLVPRPNMKGLDVDIVMLDVVMVIRYYLEDVQ